MNNKLSVQKFLEHILEDIDRFSRCGTTDPMKDDQIIEFGDHYCLQVIPAGSK